MWTLRGKKNIRYMHLKHILTKYKNNLQNFLDNHQMPNLSFLLLHYWGNKLRIFQRELILLNWINEYHENVGHLEHNSTLGTII